MELARIKDTLRAEPFRPFSLRLVDGREFPVPHPEFLYVPPNMRRTVLVANISTGAMTIVDAVMIASITFSEDNGDAGGSNGAGGRPGR